MSDTSNGPRWPDPLSAPEPDDIQQMLVDFWKMLNCLPALLNRGETLLASETATALRTTVIDMMLALNGVRRPPETRHLNSYLSDNQRAALERTLCVPDTSAGAWIGQAVALIVIYRWYAPQLVKRHDLIYPADLEADTWLELRRSLPDWPAEVTTD